VKRKTPAQPASFPDQIRPTFLSWIVNGVAAFPAVSFAVAVIECTPLGTRAVSQL
jgi:hypothetical protein